MKSAKILAGAALAALAFQGSLTAARADTALTQTVAALDRKLFDAFNACDLETLGAMTAEDLEFYHDKDGLNRGRDWFLGAVKRNICGKVRRDLVPGSVAVYPLPGYGAVEVGAHVFCDPKTQKSCDPDKSGFGRFLTVWRNENGTWLMARAISYDHLSDWERKKQSPADGEE